MIILDMVNGSTESINFASIAKQVHGMLEQKPFLLKQAIPSRKLVVKPINLYKGWDKLKHSLNHHVTIFYYDEKPLLINLLSVLITTEGDEIQCKHYKKDPPVRVDHVPASKLHEYLSSMRQFQDEQLKDVPPLKEQELIQKNDVIFMGFMAFIVGISIVSLIEAFIRVSPFIGFPMTLLYVGIGFGVTQLVSYKMTCKLRDQQKFQARCPLLMNPPFTLVEDKITKHEKDFTKLLEDLAEMELEKEPEIVKSEQKKLEPISDAELQIENVTSMPEEQPMLVTSPRAQVFQAEIDKMLGAWTEPTNTPAFTQDMMQLILLAVCHRYVTIKNSFSSGLRTLLASKESQLVKIKNLIRFYREHISVRDDVFEEFVPLVTGMVDRLTAGILDGELKPLFTSMKELVMQFSVVTEDLVLSGTSPLQANQAMMLGRELEPMVELSHSKTLESYLTPANISMVKHDKESSAPLLSLNTQENHKTRSLVNTITLAEEFTNYWDYDRSFLLIHDQASQGAINDFKELIKRLDKDAASITFFTLALPTDTWSEVKRPVILYKNDEKQAFVIEEFDPGSFLDVIEDAPSRNTQVTFEDFEDIRAELVNRLGRNPACGPLNDPDKIIIHEASDPVFQQEEISIDEAESFPDPEFIEEGKEDIVLEVPKPSIDPELEPLLQESYLDKQEMLSQGTELFNGYQDVPLGENPEVDYAKITTREAFLDMINDKRITYCILHDGSTIPEKMLPQHQIDFRIRSISLEDCQTNERLQDIIKRKWLIHDGQAFKNLTFFKVCKNVKETKLIYNYFSALERSRKRVERKKHEQLQDTGFIGILVGEFDNIKGPKMTYQLGHFNGEFDIPKVLQNILSDEQVQHARVEYRTISNHKACYLLRRERGPQFDRGQFLEAFIAFFKPDMSGAMLDRLQATLHPEEIFGLERVEDRGKAFYEQVKAFLLKVTSRSPA
ncbi:MAG: hypothetical protein EAX96_05840 [Candidatus Lokiarchaeota archaeon]|nr:hypothetical protein [Candidatus Lokiarchaeota archaeon]